MYPIAREEYERRRAGFFGGTIARGPCLHGPILREPTTDEWRQLMMVEGLGDDFTHLWAL
jgi:hypothetical protein